MASYRSKGIRFSEKYLESLKPFVQNLEISLITRNIEYLTNQSKLPKSIENMMHYVSQLASEKKKLIKISGCKDQDEFKAWVHSNIDMPDTISFLLGVESISE